MPIEVYYICCDFVLHPNICIVIYKLKHIPPGITEKPGLVSVKHMVLL